MDIIAQYITDHPYLILLTLGMAVVAVAIFKDLFVKFTGKDFALEVRTQEPRKRNRKNEK